MSNAAALAEARLWVGTPYVVGQAVRGRGADCLGLIRGVHAVVFGLPRPLPAPAAPEPWPCLHTVEARLCAAADAWLHRRGGAPAPGDVVLIQPRPDRPGTHMGVWEDGGRLINAVSLRGVVCHGVPRLWQIRGAWGWPA